MTTSRSILSFKEFQEHVVEKDVTGKGTEKTTSKVSSRQKRVRELIREIVRQQMRKRGLVV